MRPLKMAATIVLGFTLGMPVQGDAAEYPLKEPHLYMVEAQQNNPAPADDMPVYKPRQHRPPPIGPRGRVGSGVRGKGGKGAPILPLAPDHIGFSKQEQPSLFWYLAKTTSWPIEFTLVDTRSIRPVVETRIKSPAQPGVQRISLKDFVVTLAPGVTYKWYITLVLDPESPSRNVIAGGIIERVDLVEALTIHLSYAGSKDAVRAYAEAGLWYDAVMAISDLIDVSPKDPDLRCRRAALLRQIDLTEIARNDLREVMEVDDAIDFSTFFDRQCRK